MHRRTDFPKKTRSHPTNLNTIKMTWRTFTTEDPQLLGVTVKKFSRNGNLATRALWKPKCIKMGLLPAHSDTRCPFVGSHCLLSTGHWQGVSRNVTQTWLFQSTSLGRWAISSDLKGRWSHLKQMAQVENIHLISIVKPTRCTNVSNLFYIG